MTEHMKQDGAFAVVYRRQADGRWQAEVQDLPDVHATGKTIDHAKRNAWSAAKRFFERNPLLVDSLVPTTVVGYVRPLSDDPPLTDAPVAMVPTVEGDDDAI